MTHYRHGVWQDHDGNEIELTEPEIEMLDGHVPDDAETTEKKPKRSRSASSKKADPRESKGAQ